MKAVRRPVLKAIGIIATLAFAVAVGYIAAGNLQPATRESGTTSSAKDLAYNVAGGAATGAGDAAVGAPSSVAAPESVTQPSAGTAEQRMVVSSASMELRVKDAQKSIAGIRRIAAASDSEISNLYVNSGEISPQPVPLDARPADANVTGPVSAQVTLRVPAEKLAAVQRQVASLGTVVSQSVAADDVTQQHVDMTARLKNLQAEEARLRTFLARTGKVSELLEVERELARVRGEIESLQAQITYLERQAAMATLSIALTEPGPVVSPGSEGWGLGAAITAGVRAAVAVIRASITVLIAALPVLLLIGAVVLIVRLLRRRRAGTRTDIGETKAGEE